MTPSEHIGHEDIRRVPPGTASRRLEQAGWEFESGVLEQLLERDPQNVELMAALAEAYTRARRYRKGLELDRRLVACSPGEPLFHYNLACSLSLTGDLESAADALVAAIDLGYRDFAHMERDSDLRRLRKDVQWVRVRERVHRARAGDGD